jgi:hypothetical protein
MYQKQTTMTKDALMVAGISTISTDVFTMAGGKFQIKGKNSKLSREQVNALYWYCLNTNGNGKLPDLGAKQRQQLAAYAIEKAESTTNQSNKYSFLKDVTRALFNLSTFGVTKVHLTLEGDIYHLYNSDKCVVPLATFTELSELDQYCRENNYKYDATKILQ